MNSDTIKKGKRELMSRYAKANQTIDDLKALIRKTAIRGSDDGNLTTYCDGEVHQL